MSKVNEEFFKGKAGWYKQLFTLFFAVEAGCIAWFVANVDKAYKIFVILDIVVVIALICALIIMASKVLKYLKLLRE